MLFNSVVFVKFFAIVFVLYWAMRRIPLRLQNLFILAASYAFYAYWDYRFLSLLVFSSLATYLTGILLSKSVDRSRRKLLAAAGVSLNLGILFAFKYFGFFLASATEILRLLGYTGSLGTIGVLLPLGISFYTFRAVTYIVDVYREELSPSRDMVSLFAYVGFFPTLIAGPIDKAKYMLPQFQRPRTFSDSGSRDALRQILNGYMKKLLIADNIAPITDELFANYSAYSGITLLGGAVLFAVQIYCDFSGYSDIAIGTSRLLGFHVTRNFNYPYFSRDIAEFWRRWHISLSNFLRDYLYVPLCGKRPSRLKRALFIVFTFAVCGLWHGANWTFVIWGLLLGIYFVPITVVKTRRYIGTAGGSGNLPSFREFSAMLLTNTLVLITWVFFKSASVSSAMGYFSRAFSSPFTGASYTDALIPMLAVSALLLLVEWFQRHREFFLQIPELPKAARWSIYVASLLLIAAFHNTGNPNFIYFQF